jgi:hypothetical protein
MDVNNLSGTDLHTLVIKLSQFLLLQSLRILCVDCHGVGVESESEGLRLFVLAFYFSNVLLDCYFLFVSELG